MWFNCKKTLSHNCLFNFILGNRGCGKTYSAKKWCVDDYLKNGKQFVYIRRYDTELVDNNEFFNAIKNDYPDHEFKVKGYTYLIDEEVVGFAIPLSKAVTKKSTEFPLVNKIIFDEFLLETDGAYKYIKNEVRHFLGLYETIARNRDVRVLFLGNSVSQVNPYFLYFNLHMPYEKDIYKKKDILLQIVDNKEYKEMKHKSRFGQLIHGTEFEEYAINNKFLLDNSEFIDKKGSNSRYFLTFKYKNNTLGVWVDYSKSRYYVSDDVEKDYKLVYSLTLDDHTTNTILLSRISQCTKLKIFLQAYKMGIVYFENIKVKSITYDILKMLINGIR